MGIVIGIKYNIEGVLLAFRTPKLLFLGLARFLIIVLFSFVLIGTIFYWHEQILSMIWTMPESGWMIYLWTIVSWLLSVILAVIAMVLAYLMSQIFFCVFIMDYMSRITERIVLGEEGGAQIQSVFGFFIYLIKQEIPRAFIPVIITLLVMILGLFTPLSPFIIIVSSITATVFLSWDNTDLTPARRMIPFSKRIEFLKQNLGFHLGFGLLFLIPGLNILFLSFAPVGATLFYIQAERVK